MPITINPEQNEPTAGQTPDDGTPAVEAPEAEPNPLQPQLDEEGCPQVR